MSHSADHPQSVGNSTLDDQHSHIGSNTEQEREATELHSYAYASNTELVLHGPAAQAAAASGTLSAVRSFWKRHVVATVPHTACRDYFGL